MFRFQHYVTYGTRNIFQYLDWQNVENAYFYKSEGNNTYCIDRQDMDAEFGPNYMILC